MYCIRSDLGACLRGALLSGQTRICSISASNSRAEEPAVKSADLRGNVSYQMTQMKLTCMC